MSSKIQEGEKHKAAAEKYLKTSLTKWKVDYDSAADEYKKAAMCYRNAKNLVECKECLLKCAEMHKQGRQFFHSAKALDQAMLLCKDLNDFKSIRNLAEKACHLYRQHGSPQSGASSLKKAAKILEVNCPQEALALYKIALDITMTEDSSCEATEYASKVARILVKLNMFDEAADAIRTEIGLHQAHGAIGRLAVALVIVHLAREDSVAAEKAFREWGNYCDAQEVATLKSLLQAYEDDDPEMAERALASPFIKSMDVEYARLARDIKLPRGCVANQKGNKNSDDHQDYEEGGLC